MDTRHKIKTRKLKEEDGDKRKKELKKGKALPKGKEKVIGNNDIIVSPFANKVKLEDGECSNPVKPEVVEEEEVKVEEDVKVVTVEEKVDLEEEPCVEQEGSAEMGHAMEVTVPVAGTSSQHLGISLDSTPAAQTTLEEMVNYFVGVVGRMSSELKELKEKLSKDSLEMSPPPPPTIAGTNSNRDPQYIEAPEGGVNHLDLATESPLANEDEAVSNHCLVCFKNVPSSCDDVHDDCPLIVKQLQAIFVLKNLLCIPSTSLGKFLEMVPDENPGSWIHLCGECGEVVEKAWRIHDDIVNASKKLKGIQKHMINKIKCSTNCPPESIGPQSESDIGTVVTRESRQFVIDHDYGRLLDPFPNGDLEACRRLTEESRWNQAKTSEKPKLAQQISSESEVLRRKIRVTKSRNMISRRKKSQTKSTAQRRKPHNSVRMEVSPKLKAAPRCTKKKTDTPNYPCNQCEKRFQSKTGLYLHKKTIHEKNFKYRDNSRKRRQKVQRKCPHCDLISGKDALALHIKRVHEKAFAVSCQICGNRYNHHYELDLHRASIHGICAVEECRLEFPGDRRGLRNHQLEAHGREINVFGCEECGKLFTRLASLRGHQRTVHGPQKGLQNTREAKEQNKV